MGLLDNLKNGAMKGVLSSVAGSLAGSKGGSNVLQNAIMGMVTKEGVGGLVDKLAKSGIKEQVMSWVSKGKNLPVNAEQLTSALGAGTISNLVKQTGMDKDSLVQSLVKALPAVIDKVTPDGKVDEKQASSLLKNIDIGKIGGILGGFLKK